MSEFTNKKDDKGRYLCSCGKVANPKNVVKDYYNGAWHRSCECNTCKEEILALQNER
jgi:hypothetical protein